MLSCHTFDRRHALRLALLLALAAVTATLGGAGCAGETLAKDSGGGVVLDSSVSPDGPVPWFRDAGCGPGSSGASGQPCPCNGASGASGQPCDGGTTPPADTMPADLPTPDICVPPSTWTCKVTFGFNQRGSETTGGIHGDFNGASPTPWVTKAMTLSAGRWSVELTLQNGQRLNYKFVTDEGLASAQWFHDSSNPNTTPDGLGGLNSYLDVSCADPCSR